ncbi:MAG: type IV pilus biogenesis/stability protein PilW [Burkholderiaceae bacterium]
MIRRIVLALVLPLAACSHVSRDVASSGDAERRATARVELAKAYFAEGSYVIALEEVNHALDVMPDRADALSLRSLALMHLGEPESAKQSMARALRAAPEDPALQKNLGWLLCETGKAAESLPYFDRALAQRRYSTPANAAMNAGTCSLRVGDRPRAARYFQRALQSEPGLLAAHAQLARLAVAQGDDQAARRHFKQVIASGHASSQDYALALALANRLGDRDTERSIVAQWKRAFPESPQLQAYLRTETHER